MLRLRRDPMPWLETKPVEQRQEFIHEYLKRTRSFSELCRQFGVARKTGYKWVSRFMSGGLTGLHDESRARDTMAHRTPALVEGLIVEMRKRHPTWGPKKIIRRLSDEHPAVEFPAYSTASLLLKKHGLVAAQKRRSRPKTAVTELQPVFRPNATWAVDYKGNYQLGCGAMCYPATVTDLYSRKLLRCVALTTTKRGPMQAVLTSAFREYGLPDVLRADNGPPFRTAGVIRLSKLSVFLIELGIRPEFIEPGHPEQNGSHERMHRTLEEALYPRSATFLAQQRRFNAFRRCFNAERPHEALGLRTPESIYRPSERPMPQRVEYRYPAHVREVRIQPKGGIFWRRHLHPVALSLENKVVGVEYLCDGLARVQFHSHVIGMLDEQENVFIPNIDWPITVVESY